MATDPDPSNDLRGVSGYSFALPGEPDFTQLVHFQKSPGVVSRSYCPEPSVIVTKGKWYRAEVVETEQGVIERYKAPPEKIGPDHPLFEARIDLLNEPIFDSRNSTIVYNGYGLLSPFDMEIRSPEGYDGPSVTIQRSYFVDPQNPSTDLESIPIDELMPHVMGIAVYDPANPPNSFSPGSPDILFESGIIAPTAFRQRRLKQLEAELKATPAEDRVATAALKKRIAELRIDDPQNRRTAQLGAKVLVPYDLNGKEAIVNGTSIEAGDAWPLEMWLGGWDADALSFFVIGTLQIALSRDPLAI